MNTFDIILQQVGLFVIYILARPASGQNKSAEQGNFGPISKFVIKWHCR